MSQSIQEKLAELRRRNQAAEAGGGPERKERQHKEGKLSARERVELLLDEGSFEEFDKLVAHRCADFDMASQRIPGDGVVSGYGHVDGRTVFVFAQDFTVFGGSMSEANAAKIKSKQDGLTLELAATPDILKEVAAEEKLAFRLALIHAEQPKDYLVRRLREGRAHEMEPLNAYERRIVHSVLTEYPDIITESRGEDPQRFVVIKPFLGS